MSENKILILLPMVMMVCTNAIAYDVKAEMLEVRSDILAVMSNIEYVERSLIEDIERYDIELLKFMALDLAVNEDVYERVTWLHMEQKGLKNAAERKLAKIRQLQGIYVNVMAMIKCCMELATFHDVGVCYIDCIGERKRKINSMREEIDSMIRKMTRLFNFLM